MLSMSQISCFPLNTIHSSNTHVPKNKFTPEEDAKLIEIVKKNGSKIIGCIIIMSIINSFVFLSRMFESRHVFEIRLYYNI